MRVSSISLHCTSSLPSNPRQHLSTFRRISAPCSSARRPSQLLASNRFFQNYKGRDQVSEETNYDVATTAPFVSAVALFAVSVALLLAPVAASANLPKIELFEPMRYVGRWYEVASLKKGFAGEGQQDCHCTQGISHPVCFAFCPRILLGIYVPIKNAKDEIRLEVNTFCFHGGPKGRLSGIRGDVTCANPRDLYMLPEFETAFERKEQIREKCILRFPQIPFIPAEPYDVIRTDYETYAIVQGANDTSFVQIYSRTPNPGKAFVEKQKEFLRQYGYPVDDIRETPQDCEIIPMDTLSQMMGDKMMDAVLTNTVPAPEEEVEDGVRFEGPRNLLQTAKDLLTVFGQND